MIDRLFGAGLAVILLLGCLAGYVGLLTWRLLVDLTDLRIEPFDYPETAEPRSSHSEAPFPEGNRDVRSTL